MEQKEQLLGTLSEAYDDLLIAADVAMTRGDPSVSGWGVREVLARVAAWEAEATARIPQLAAGAADKEYDVEAFNAAAIAASSQAHLRQVRAALEDAHARLVTLLDGLGPEVFEAGGPAYLWVATLIPLISVHALQLREGHIDRAE